jgi:tetratricopeptide (TPR) repeat protein
VQTIENAVNKANGLAAIAPLYATAGHQQQANQILAQSIESINAIPDSYQKTVTQQDITRNLTSSRQYEYASIVGQTIPDNFDQAKALRDVGLQAVQAKDYNQALQVVQTIDKRFIDDKNIVLNKLAIALAQGGEYNQALQTAQKIQNFNSTYTYRAKTLAAIAKYYTKTKQPQKAATVFSQALQTANTLPSLDSIAKAKAEIALEYALAGQANKATETLTQALKLVPNINDASISLATLQEMTNLYLEAGQYNLALQSIKAFNNPVYKNGISQELANKYLEAGQYDQAMQLVNTLTTPEDKTRLLVAIAGKYIQNQQNAKASQALTQALQVAKTLKDPESKVMVFKVETDSQGNVISKTEVEDPYDRASFLESIAINYAQAGFNNQARQVAQLIKTPAIRSQLNQRLNCY